MKRVIILVAFVILSCSKNPEIYIEHIEGYWEIEEVTLANGEKKSYSVNETIDYISLNDSLKGFRVKLKPGVNGTYYTSDNAETITLKIEDDKINIYYNTQFDSWKETILKATEEQLLIQNDNKDVYLYNRYQPINLDVQ
ncbi:MAG: hypothetical protein HKN40_08030 [Winogradskyella sp.]|uniref:lipocalin family protein n=1 Tax=Winogradskyella sp. TaxID=1883156 RepID=UPI0018249CC9|nr:hypothetical protein [Winogradskyella sp.]